MRYDFFIAHASEDGGVATQLCERLKSNGHAVFIDIQEILPGGYWAAEIPEAQCASSITVVLLSQHSRRSHYVVEEISRAIELMRSHARQHKIIPVMLAGIEPGTDMPYGLASIQFADATTENSLARLPAELARILAIFGAQGSKALTTSDTETEVSAAAAARTQIGHFGSLLSFCMAAADRAQELKALLSSRGVSALTELTERYVQNADSWFAKFSADLTTKRLVIIVLSRDYMDSSLCKKEELPSLLCEQQRTGLKVLAVKLEPCADYPFYWLNRRDVYEPDAVSAQAPTSTAVRGALEALVEAVAESATDTAGGAAVLVGGDMTKAADVDHLVAEARAAYGDTIDILVNVVGGLVARKTLSEMDMEFLESVMRLNLTSTFLTMKSTVPHMPAGGSVINLVSLAGRDGGGPGAAAYAASKGAVMTFTRGMAKELCPANIRVNCVCPGMISTTFHDQFTKDAVRANVAAGTPSKREGEAHEVAELVAYLAPEESGFMTGTSIDINGGLAFS